ncbi:unnamed protein product [Symbiodinium sp. KB8]|nr:unnamed protein product [Symbiodinium sp. KB8]
MLLAGGFMAQNLLARNGEVLCASSNGKALQSLLATCGRNSFAVAVRPDSVADKFRLAKQSCDPARPRCAVGSKRNWFAGAFCQNHQRFLGHLWQEPGDEQDEQEPEPFENYGGKRVRDLRALCQKRGLSSKGNKAQLIAALEADDEETQPFKVALATKGDAETNKKPEAEAEAPSDQAKAASTQDTYQQLFELAVRGLAGAQAEVDSARAQVNFAVKHWRSATDNQNWAAASTWEQKVKEAEQKVKKAKEEVQEAQQKVREAEQKVEKAKEEVEKAKQEVKEAVQKVKEVTAEDFDIAACTRPQFKVKPNKFVQLVPCMNACIEAVEANLPQQTDATSVRVPPTVLSRCMRGGKTTVLMHVFDKLKSASKNPIFISFNGDSLISQLQNESVLDTMRRAIAIALLKKKPQDRDEAKRVLCRQDVLKEYLESKKDVVLIIDELHVLLKPSESPGYDEVGAFLREQFLDPEGRYLIFSTHAIDCGQAAVEALTKSFLSEFFTGVRGPDTDPIRAFDSLTESPASGQIRWILAYVGKMCLYLGLPKIAGWVEEIPRLSEKVESGQDWEAIVLVALSLRCVQVKYGSAHDLLYLPETEPVKGVFFYNVPQEHCKTPHDMVKWWKQWTKQWTISPALFPYIAVLSPNYAKTAICDAMWIYQQHPGSELVVRGLQSKLGKDLPASDMPDGMLGLLMRGNAPAQSTQPRQRTGWEYRSADAIREFLGASLSALYPSDWPRTDGS